MLVRGTIPCMERDDPGSGNSPANEPAEPAGENTGEDTGERADVAESSGYTTTKQAAKVLGVSRRTVQSYVRRGELEAVVEGDGVEKTFFVSIDSLNALRERRRISGERAPHLAGSASSASSDSEVTTNLTKGAGEGASELIEVVQDLQYRLGRAEAQVELTARTDSTLREALERERERADRLEAELRESRRSQLGSPRDEPHGPETAAATTEGTDGCPIRPGASADGRTAPF